MTSLSDEVLDLTQLRKHLHKTKKSPKEIKINYYKTGPGDYAEHDQFIGVSVPQLRKISKRYRDLPLTLIQELIESPINEERLLALFILIHHYQKGTAQIKQGVYQFYLVNLPYINNWNLVDASAHWIMGAHLLNVDKSILLTLVRSPILWERRIAIVSTWYFIRHHKLEWTLQLADTLLSDSHDLIHKAVGWMLRELGKRDKKQLVHFIKKNIHRMPRTTLRYAIEKFTPSERKFYLSIPREKQA
ncbi:MAG: DNA alkylation repair protein [Gammaproteobacteria bacterium]|nr:DNA alkylation repair protein [Gammaproteobacteria bacterium]